MIAAIDEIGGRRDGLDYDIDGAVVRLHDPAAFDAAGFNSAEPRGAIAFKYPPEEKLTKLLAVEWPVGKIGRVPPRAKVEPVFVGGVTVENITLHNPRLIRERDLRIGDTVAVVRRGDVIPFAGRSLPEDRDGTEVEIVPPTHCPSCGSELEIRGTGEERWCLNLQCPAQATRRLMHWASRHAADMEGVGDVWIEKLADDGVLKRRSDFYDLTAEQLLGYERMGEVSASNMVDSIEPLQGPRAAPRADRPGDPDGVRGHGQAPLPGGLRAHRGRRGGDGRGAGGDPRHRPEGRRERRRFLRPARGPRGDRRAARTHGVDLDVLDEDRPVDVAGGGATRR